MVSHRLFIFAAQLLFSLLILSAVPISIQGQSTTVDDAIDARADTSALARGLGSRDPLVRQRAAESLAHLAALDQKTLVEGYYLQEKNKRVRLALEWARYRMGKSEALFRIVRDLDSSRHDQAVGYLSQLDTPAILYPFLKQEDSPPRIIMGLLETLARIGDADSLETIKPFRDLFYPGVAEAAETATAQIERRLTHTQVPVTTRPRTVGNGEPTSP